MFHQLHHPGIICILCDTYDPVYPLIEYYWKKMENIHIWKYQKRFYAIYLNFDKYPYSMLSICAINVLKWQIKYPTLSTQKYILYINALYYLG